MSVLSILAPLLSAAIAAGAALLGVKMNQRVTDRQQTRAEHAAERAKTETATRGLLASVMDLRVALDAHQSRWNTARPRLLTAGQSFLEFASSRGTSGWYAQGVARAGKVISDWHERSFAATEALLTGPVSRVNAAISHVLVLADREVATAAGQVGEALIAVVTAYDSAGMYRVRAGRVAITEANDKLRLASENLVRVANLRLGHAAITASPDATGAPTPDRPGVS